MHQASRLLTLALAGVLLSPIGDVRAADAITAVPPVTWQGPVVPKAAARFVLPDLVPASRHVLGPVTESERLVLKSRNAVPAARSPDDRKAAAKADVRTKARPMAIGIGRDVPTGGEVSLESLPWIPTADGGRAARIVVTSSGAAALRVQVAATLTDPDVVVRMQGSTEGAEVVGPLPWNTVADATRTSGAWWTPVLEGDTATIELYAPADASLRDAKLALTRVSHLLVAGRTLSAPSAKDVRDIGLADSCEVDVACVTPSQPLTDAANAVGKIVFSDIDGGSYACSGTMLADSTASMAPYFFTAAHCITSAYEAATINVYWFFRAQVCGSKAIPPYQLQTGGAKLLARSDDWDYGLVRLNQMPPAGVRYSAWRAEPVPTGAIGTVVHHPQGDLAKWSQGNASGYFDFDDGSSLLIMQYTQGSTEVGSSGSGLLTFLAGGNYYELRGGLYGGSAACSYMQGTDYYSRLDRMLPLVKQYLTPNQPMPDGQVVVVEYYNPGLEHYFMTADADEIAGLDAGVFQGWERTGVRFIAYSTPGAGRSSVCRFYRKPEFGDSHFYSAKPGECADTLAKYGADWVYERQAAFYIAQPDNLGNCTAGTRPIYRFLNTRTINHRFTPEVAIRDDLRSTPGWIAEGEGIGVVMCSPTGY